MYINDEFFEKPRQDNAYLTVASPKLTIVYEDEHLLVVNKPKHMVVHPADGNPDGTLVNALIHHCGPLTAVNGDFRQGIVHRIDKDTSGLFASAFDLYVNVPGLPQSP